MDVSDNWLMCELKRYRSIKNKNPYFPSDWNIEVDYIQFPLQFVQESLAESALDSHLYFLTDDQEGIKTYLSYFFSSQFEFELPTDNITVSINATNAIRLTLMALKEMGLVRFLVVTPVYFSIIETLRDLNCNIVFYHLFDSEGFQLHLETIEKIINYQFIDVIIITSPIYSVGIDYSEETYRQLIALCDKLDIWIFFDFSFGGLPWNNTVNIFEHNVLRNLVKAQKSIVIESIAKRLFVNGIKHSIIFADEEVISKIDRISSKVSGGFCNAQIKLLKKFYNKENISILVEILKENIMKIKNNYSLIKAALQGSNFSIYEANSGIFTIVYHTEKTIEKLDTKFLTKKILFNSDIMVITSDQLYLHKKNHFGFRINLLKKTDLMLSSIFECINKYF